MAVASMLTVRTYPPLVVPSIRSPSITVESPIVVSRGLGDRHRRDRADGGQTPGRGGCPTALPVVPSAAPISRQSRPAPEP